MMPQIMQAQLGQAPTPDDLFADFQQRTMGQPPQQPAPSPMAAGGMGGKSGGFGPASPMMTAPPTGRPGPAYNPPGPKPQTMDTNPNFQGGLRPAPANYRAPLTGGHVGRQFISQGATGPLIQGFGLR
jgi:hypothetical protein